MVLVPDKKTFVVVVSPFTTNLDVEAVLLVPIHILPFGVIRNASRALSAVLPPATVVENLNVDDPSVEISAFILEIILSFSFVKLI